MSERKGFLTFFYGCDESDLSLLWKKRITARTTEPSYFIVWCRDTTMSQGRVD